MWCLYKKGKLDTDIQTETMLCDWSNAAVSQGMPRVSYGLQETEEARKDSTESLRGFGLGLALTSF